MTKTEAEDVVQAAIKRGLAHHGGLAAKLDAIAEQASERELEDLALIYMAELSDWTVQLAWLVGDKRWCEAKMALPPANLAVQKLAGVVSKMAYTLPSKVEDTQK